MQEKTFEIENPKLKIRILKLSDNKHKNRSVHSMAGAQLLPERVEKVDTLLNGNAARSKIEDFRTALYPRQYHPSVLEKPLYSAVFRLQGVFPPRMSAEKQKMQHNRRKSRLWGLSTN